MNVRRQASQSIVDGEVGVAAIESSQTFFSSQIPKQEEFLGLEWKVE